MYVHYVFPMIKCKSRIEISQVTSQQGSYLTLVNSSKGSVGSLEEECETSVSIQTTFSKTFAFNQLLYKTQPAGIGNQKDKAI